MCNCLIDNICNITKEACPYVYFCYKKNRYEPLRTMPNNCKVKQPKVKVPRGYFEVVFERKGWLYVNVRGNLYKFRNPYGEIPPYVKLCKVNGAWAIKE